MARVGGVGGVGGVLAIDSTMYDTHHRSRHYEHRCRRNASGDRNTVKQRQSIAVKRLPKLGIGVHIGGHFIASAISKTGMGSDAPDFPALLIGAKKRCAVRTVLADAGYDSQHNHRLARDQLGITSWIKATVGRPGKKPATDRHRRHMQRKLQGSQAGQPYGQRVQVETVMSMLKRNMGTHLRALTRHGGEMELLLKVLVHNLMILWRKSKGRNRAGRESFWFWDSS